MAEPALPERSAADGLRLLTALVLVGLALCSWRFEELLQLVGELSVELQKTPLFDDIVELLS